MTRADDAEIQGLMKRYFDGLYQADSRILRTVFHPRLSYVNATAGNNEFLGLDAYMARVDGRTAPATPGDPRREAVERVHLHESGIGLVEARMTMLGRDYQDILTLVRTEDGWKVLTKVFAYSEKEE